MTGELPSGPSRHNAPILFEGTADVDTPDSLSAADLHTGQQGPQEAIKVSFTQFYREEMAALVRFVRRYGADTYAATDAAQDAFAEAYPQWDTIEDPRPWLRLVACRIYYRRRLREIPVEDFPDRPVIYEDTVEIGEQGRRVFEALATLPERQRQVMAWRLDGYGHAEIAQHLGITTAAVRQNLHRARQSLKELLGLGQNDQEGENR